MLKKKTIFLGLGLLILAFLLIFLQKQNKSDLSQDISSGLSSTAIIAVNGIEVGQEEYLLHLKREIAMTYNHFYQEYGVENSPDFWSTPHNGITPIDYIKERTNKKVVESKLIHDLAKRYNVVEGFDFDNFKLQWKDYNKKRKEAHDKDSIVYGSVFTDMHAYYNYLLNNLEIRLKEKLSNTQFNNDDGNLMRYYEKIKKDRFAYAEKIEIALFGYDYGELSYKKSNQRIKQILTELKSGLPLQKSLEKKYPAGVYQQRTFYDSVPIYGEDNPDEIIKRNAQNMEFNELRLVSAQQGVYIIKLRKPLQFKYYPFDKVVQQVRYDYDAENYSEFLAKEHRNAVIAINEKTYQAISNKAFH